MKKKIRITGLKKFLQEVIFPLNFKTLGEFLDKLISGQCIAES
jgi:hypothetical protein